MDDILKNIKVVCKHKIGITGICNSCEIKRCRLILESILHCSFKSGSHTEIFYVVKYSEKQRRSYNKKVIFDGINTHLKIAFDYVPKEFYESPIGSKMRKIKITKENRCNKLGIAYIQIRYKDITMEEKLRVIKTELRVYEVNVPKILAELARDAQFMKNAKNHN